MGETDLVCMFLLAKRSRQNKKKTISAKEAATRKKQPSGAWLKMVDACAYVCV